MVWSEENLCPIGVVIWLGFAAAGAHQRHRLGEDVAAVYTGDGGGADRSRLDAARGAVVSRAAVATASGGVNQPWWVGSGKGREPEVATCVRMAGVKGVTRAQRAAGIP